jgi:uncharacterized membrane protein YphA (DoxX/SURF4 family)
MVLSGMKKIKLLSYHLPRIAVGGIFTYSGIIKLADVKGFANLISQYDLVPESLLAPVAVGLPGLELLAGMALLFEIPGALSVIFAMLLMFCTVLWYGILKDLDIDCGCFSTTELQGQDSLRQALYRDFVMIALCGNLFLYRFLRSKREQGAGLLMNFRKII